MAHILALDSSSEFLQIVLRRSDGAVLEACSQSANSHDEEISSLTQKVLAEGQVSIEEIEFLGIGLGPGSFTGLRIGLSFIKALAQSGKIPVYGVSSFEAAAYAPNLECPNVAVFADARRDECFIGVYSRGGQNTKEQVVVVPQTVAVSEWRSLLANAHVDSNRKSLAVICLENSVSFVNSLGLENLNLTRCPSLASNIAAMAERDRETISPFSLTNLAELSPLYVRSVAAKTIAERAAATAVS